MIQRLTKQAKRQRSVNQRNQLARCMRCVDVRGKCDRDSLYSDSHRWPRDRPTAEDKTVQCAHVLSNITTRLLNDEFHSFSASHVTVLDHATG